jgi:hypothetical protein
VRRLSASLFDCRHAENLAEEVDDLLGSGQATEIAVNDDAVEAWYTKVSRSPKSRVKSSIGLYFT